MEILTEFDKTSDERMVLIVTFQREVEGAADIEIKVSYDVCWPGSYGDGGFCIERLNAIRADDLTQIELTKKEKIHVRQAAFDAASQHHPDW
jgi:hypothetical protein